jgi:hypothetical protein
VTRVVVSLLVGALLSGCAQMSYAQFVRFEDPDATSSPWAGCHASFSGPAKLEMQCPDVQILVEDSLRDSPYDVLRRWPEEEAARQRAALGGLETAPVRVSTGDLSLPDGERWPFLHAVSLAGQDGLVPVEDTRIVRAPFDRDGVRIVRCTATSPVGVDRCAEVVPALLRSTPVARLPTEQMLFEQCESARFPLHDVRGATRTICKSLRLVEHDRAQQLPEPRALVRVFGLPSGATESEDRDVPQLDGGSALEARAFTLTVNGRVAWSGVLARDKSSKRFVHCGMQLPPALAQRHCYRAVVLKLTGGDRLNDISPGG